MLNWLYCIALPAMLCTAVTLLLPLPPLLALSATQWADPGDCPYIDEKGNRFWKQADGSWTQQDPTVSARGW